MFSRYLLPFFLRASSLILMSSLKHGKSCHQCSNYLRFKNVFVLNSLVIICLLQQKSNKNFAICCYDVVRDTWSTLPPIPHSSGIQVGSLCHTEDHLYVIYKSPAPCRYSIAKNQWQSIASSKAFCDLNQKAFCNKAAIVYKSCSYVLYGQGQVLWQISGYGSSSYPEVSSSVLYCFDSKKNDWEQKASAKTPHFGSSLLVVNNNLYVAGARCSLQPSRSDHNHTGFPAGGPAAIEVYNDQGNVWFAVKQTHIPKDNLGAVKN